MLSNWGMSADARALLQVLSGRAKLDKNTEKAGEITYNGKPLSALHAKRIAAYIAEQREHLANLSVRETCEFARDCTDAGDHKNKDARQLKELVGDAIAEGQVRGGGSEKVLGC
jgi:ABC-type multidrug transport system ATPase subunit